MNEDAEARDAELIDRLYEGGADPGGLGLVRSLVARVRDEHAGAEPPQAVSARLLQAAEEHAPKKAAAAVAPEQPGLWEKLRRWWMPMSGAVLVAGALALYLNQGGRAAEPRHAAAPADRGGEEQHAGAPAKNAEPALAEPPPAEPTVAPVAVDTPPADPAEAERPAGLDRSKGARHQEIHADGKDMSKGTGAGAGAGSGSSSTGATSTEGIEGGADRYADETPVVTGRAPEPERRAEKTDSAQKTGKTEKTEKKKESLPATQQQAVPPPPPAPPMTETATIAEDDRDRGRDKQRELTVQDYLVVARAAAKKGDCKRVAQLGAKVKSMDARYYAKTFVRDSAIKGCSK